jgi:hypothetical protein
MCVLVTSAIGVPEVASVYWCTNAELLYVESTSKFHLRRIFVDQT